MFRTLRVIVLALAATVSLVVVGSRAEAAETVTNTSDSGPGSLRQAIASAAPGDTITFDPSLSGQEITLSSGELDVPKNLTIEGPVNHVVISGNQSSRVFFVGSGVSLNIVRLTITQGWSSAGSAVWVDGNGVLEMSESTVTDNGGYTVLYGPSGATIATGDGTLNLTSSVVTNNYGNSAPIVNVTGSTTIAGSVVSGNAVPFSGAGGIYSAGTLVITDSAVTGNSAKFAGGVLNSHGSTTLTNSTVSGNFAELEGGGIFNEGGTLLINNSTVSGNNGDLGGGIFNTDNGSSLTLSYSTIAENTSRGGRGAGLFNNQRGHVSIENSILANPDPGNNNCFQDTASSIITSSGYNIDSDGTCGLTSAGDLSNVDPMLGPLATNAPGSRQTHALLAGSPAVDHIPAGVGGCATTTTRDERGIVRPQGNGCDVGAYEVASSIPVGGTVEIEGVWQGKEGSPHGLVGIIGLIVALLVPPLLFWRKIANRIR